MPSRVPSAKPRPGASLLLAATLPLLAACGGEAETKSVPDGPKPRPVQVIRVDATVDGASRSYTGTLKSRFEVDQAFRVPGKVTTRAVEVGDRVTAGQVLATLDPADYDLAVQRAQADVAAAAAQAKQTAADEARFKTLLAQGHVSASDYDRRKAAADAAAEALRAARSALDLARNELTYTTLRAQGAGVVTARMVEVGQVVDAGTPLFRVATDAPTGGPQLEAVVAIPESRLADLKATNPTVSLWAAPDVRVPAVLREFTPDADPMTRSFTARFTLKGEIPAAQMGMTATVHLDTGGPAGLVRLPRSALADFGGGWQVWGVEGGSKLVPMPVQVTQLGEETALVSGLAAGTTVVSLGAFKLTPNDPVRVVEVRP